MVRGSTPTFTCDLGTDSALFPSISATFVQEDTLTLLLPHDRMTLDGESVSFSLSEEETLAFAPGTAELQLRVATEDGTILLSDIRRVAVRRRLPEDSL